MTRCIVLLIVGLAAAYSDGGTATTALVSVGDHLLDQGDGDEVSLLQRDVVDDAQFPHRETPALIQIEPWQFDPTPAGGRERTATPTQVVASQRYLPRPFWSTTPPVPQQNASMPNRLPNPGSVEGVSPPQSDQPQPVLPNPHSPLERWGTVPTTLQPSEVTTPPVPRQDASMPNPPPNPGSIEGVSPPQSDQPEPVLPNPHSPLEHWRTVPTTLQPSEVTTQPVPRQDESMLNPPRSPDSREGMSPTQPDQPEPVERNPHSPLERWRTKHRQQQSGGQIEWGTQPSIGKNSSLKPGATLPIPNTNKPAFQSIVSVPPQHLQSGTQPSDKINPSLKPGTSLALPGEADNKN